MSGTADNFGVYLLANGFEVFVYTPVLETDDLYPVFFYKIVPDGVIFFAGFRAMLAAVKFDHKFSAWYIKVCNVFVDNELSFHDKGSVTKIIKPKMIFFLRHAVPVLT